MARITPQFLSSSAALKYYFIEFRKTDRLVLVLGFKLIAGALASSAWIGVAIGVGLT